MKNKIKKTQSKLGLAIKFFVQLVIAGLIILPTFYGIHYAYNQPEASPYFEVEKIEYQGLIYLNQEKLDSLVLVSLPKNILHVDLGQLRSLVETESWVQEAKIRRKLPNRIIISITERQPVAVAAIDNELYVVDSNGVVLAPYGPHYHSINHPIVKTEANLGEGIDELYEGLKTYYQQLNEKGIIKSKRIKRCKHRVYNLIKDDLLGNFWSKSKKSKLDEFTQKIDTDKKSPYELAQILLTS